MDEVTIYRADSPVAARQVVSDIVSRIEADRLCPFCGAKSLLRAVRALVAGSNACTCPGSPVAQQARALEAELREVLDLEPAGATDCRACRRVRASGRQYLGHDDPPPGAPCPLHALCPKHGGEPVH